MPGKDSRMGMHHAEKVTIDFQGGGSVGAGVLSGVWARCLDVEQPCKLVVASVPCASVPVR